MNLLIKFLSFFQFFTNKLSICMTTGMIAGVIGGIFLQLLQINQGGSLTLTDIETFYVSLELTIFCWIILLFILCALIRYTFSSVALPTLVNSFLTCLLTVWVCNKLSWFLFASVVGLFIGLIVGRILCLINQLLKR